VKTPLTWVTSADTCTASLRDYYVLAEER
jgi:hypothetical protein